MHPIDEIIEEAQKRGAFDHLKGKGQPLHWEENPFEPEDQRLAHHLLKNNGFTLPWIELGQALENDRLLLVQRLRVTKSAQAQEEFLRGIIALNRRILDYNLKVPLDNFQRRLLDPQAELDAALHPGLNSPSLDSP